MFTVADPCDPTKTLEVTVVIPTITVTAACVPPPPPPPPPPPSGPSIRSISKGSFGLSKDITLPAGVVAGDILYVLAVASDALPTAGTGWNLRANLNYTGTTYYALYNRTATGTDPTAVRANNGSGPWVCVAVKDASNFDVSTAVNSGTSTSPGAVTMTTTAANDLILWPLGLRATGGAVTPPTGFTLVDSQDNLTFQAALYSRTQAAAGATGIASGSVSPSQNWAVKQDSFKT